MNHGLITFGDTLLEALSLAESIEKEAQVYYQARMLGTPKVITEEQRKLIIENYNKG
jgi:L-fuculose-phosphate aldolase